MRSKRLKKELYIVAGCFIVAVASKFYSIIKYNTGWRELTGQLHIVVIIALSIWDVSILRMKNIAPHNRNTNG